MNRLSVVLFAASTIVGCSHSKPKVASMATIQPQAEKTPEKEAARQAPVPVSPHVAVSSDLAKQCTLHFENPPQAPKFDFDQFDLLPEDRDVLQQVASCLTTGPLKGHAVQLIGRADPRGTEEYNLGLGTRRADDVREYLQRLGVTARQLTEATRGAIDATGTDEASWRVDRRVDLELASS